MKRNVGRRTNITNTPAGTDQTELIRPDFYAKKKSKAPTDAKPFPLESEKEFKKPPEW